MTQDEEMNREAGRGSRALRILFWMVFSAAVLLFFWGIWSIPLLSHNEGRRLVVLQEMLTSHHWLTPTKNGFYYLEKPPLFYWAGVLFSLLSGSTAEWVLRLPSALAALFTTGFLYRRVCFYFGRQPALFSVLVLVSSYFYVMSARRAELNVFFATLCFSALFLFFDYLQREKKRYLYLAFFVLGLASLTKGPVALVFFLSPLLVYGLIRREWRVFKGLLSPVGWLLFLVVGVSWFGYALYGVPGSPLQAVIHKDIMVKVYESSTPDPFYDYVVFLLGAFAPWILLLFYKPKRWLGQFKSDKGLFLICAFGVPLVIMSCFATKNGKYILPLFPFLAAFLGCLLSEAYDEYGRRWDGRFHVLFNRVAGGILVILFGIMVLAPAYLQKDKFIVLKPFAEKIHSLQGENPVYSFRHEQIQLIYYYGAPISVLGEQRLDKELEQKKTFLLVATDRDRKDLESKDMCLLDTFTPYLDKGRQGLLFGTSDYCQKSAGYGPGMEPAAAPSTTKDR